MPTGWPFLFALLHPLLALATIALLFYAANLGLQSRRRKGEQARRSHARIAPIALVGIWLSAGSGLAATLLWREDLDTAAGAHFQIGCAVVLLVTLGAILSRFIPGNETARRIHPAIGMLALLLAILQIFFGMPLLPF